MFSVDQYAAAHRSAVIVEPFGAGTLVLTGADRASFLHALVSNDIVSLTAGTGTYSAYLTPQGRMICDMRIIETGDRLLLGVERDIAGPLAARLDALIFSEDVQVRDASEELGVIGVHGPSAAAMVEGATGVSVAALSSQYANVTDGARTIVRDDALSVVGFDIYVSSADAPAIRARVAAAGASEASPDTLETLRIEAGRPRFGTDMTTDTIPLEAGIEGRAISFTKGCYVGQEVIVRVLHRGHGRVARRLVTIVIPEGVVPARGDKIFGGAEAIVGEITSAAYSPQVQAPLAFGYVQRDCAAPGTELTVNGSQARVYKPVD